MALNPSSQFHFWNSNSKAPCWYRLY